MRKLVIMLAIILAIVPVALAPAPARALGAIGSAVLEQHPTLPQVRVYWNTTAQADCSGVWTICRFEVWLYTSNWSPVARVWHSTEIGHDPGWHCITVTSAYGQNRAYGCASWPVDFHTTSGYFYQQLQCLVPVQAYVIAYNGRNEAIGTAYTVLVPPCTRG
jgi:hypothetical protein|uniref:Secreted protein n=1 Tax=Thermorudis peleae TaxID=1382356 RepID=A0A831T901_9BACT